MTAALSERIREILEKHHVPGAAIGVVRRGETIFRHFHGRMSVEGDRPIDERVTFDIGSISKTFNAACVAVLVDEGKVSFDDTVLDHLPEWRMSDPTVTPNVQVADLVGQSLGLGEDNITNYNSSFTRSQIIEQMRFLPLRVPFRSECTYQGYGPVAAGVMVERLSGMSWEDFVEQRVAAPIGLSETFASFFRMPDRSIACDPHMTGEDGVSVAIPHRNFDNLAPAGSMTSSLRDLERWFTLFAAGGAIDGKRLLKAETVDRMLRPRIPVNPEGIHPQRWISRFAANFVTYGLGWYAHDFAGRRISEHTGALEGFFVMGCAVPSDELAVVILTNQHSSPAVHTLRYLLLAEFLGAPQEDWEARFAKVSGRAKRTPRILAGEPYPWRPGYRDPSLATAYDATDLAGPWRHPGFGTVTVSADATDIDIFGNGCDLERWHADVWRAVPRDPPVRSYYPDIFLRLVRDDVVARVRLDIPTVGVFDR